MSKLSERILAAAAELYERHGYQGATTRQIAEAAGVNEVTIFRLFGSKAALLAAALERVGSAALPELPGQPGDLNSELSEWAASVVATLRGRRPLLRRWGERPPAEPAAGDAANVVGDLAVRLSDYLESARRAGMVSDGEPLTAAAHMYVGALLSRAVTTEDEDASDAEAASAFTRVLLRAVGTSAGRTLPPAARAAPPPFVPDATGA